jgi:hypothetical protein
MTRVIWYKKGLVVGIIVMFIGVSVCSSKDASICKDAIEENIDSGGWNLGFILGRVTYFEIASMWEYSVKGEIVECIDIDTGEVIAQVKTGFFGFYLFAFLPMGYDYKIISYFEYSKLSGKVEDLGFFQRIDFMHTVQ